MAKPYGKSRLAGNRLDPIGGQYEGKRKEEMHDVRTARD